MNPLNNLSARRVSRPALCFAATLASLAILNGCSRAPAPASATTEAPVSALGEVHTVGWFKEHQAEMEAVLKQCRDNPGQLRSEPNCVNAARALDELAFSKTPDFSAPSKKF